MPREEQDTDGRGSPGAMVLLKPPKKIHGLLMLSEAAGNPCPTSASR